MKLCECGCGDRAPVVAPKSCSRPLVTAELEAQGLPVTNAAIAAVIGCNPSSVAQMRKKLAAEKSMKAEPRASVAACPANGDSPRKQPRS